MQRPYLHFDRITRAHQSPSPARSATQTKRKTGLLDLPMEVRLDIYRELRTPRHSTFIDCESTQHPAPCCPFGFPPAVLLINKKINAEAKVVFYGENTLVTVIDAEDPRQEYDPVKQDQGRRRAMLPFIKKAHIHLKMSGELIWEWRDPESRRKCVEYFWESVAALCKDFAAAASLQAVGISVRDHLYLHSWVPEIDPDAVSIDLADLHEVPYCAWEIMGDFSTLPLAVSLSLEGVFVFDKTDVFDDGVGVRQESLEEMFRSSFNQITASRAAQVE